MLRRARARRHRVASITVLASTVLASTVVAKMVKAAQATRGRHAECAYLLDRALKHPTTSEDFAGAALDVLRLALRPAYSALVCRSPSGIFHRGDSALTTDVNALAELLCRAPKSLLSRPSVLTPADAERAGQSSLARAMTACALAAIVPLVDDGTLLGLVAIGPRTGRTPYSTEDLEFCERVAARLALLSSRETLTAQVAALRTAAADSERLASVGRMAAGLAHEIRNPLVSIRTFTQLLPERHADEEFRNGFLDLTLSEIDRISTLVGEILSYARPPLEGGDSDQPHATDVGECVERTCLLLRSHARSAGVALDFDAAELSARGAIDEDKLRQVVINLVVNGIQACGERGRVSVAVSPAGRDRIAVEVRDDGAGMDAKVAAQVFQPFFTTRREGTGLGLALVQKILSEADATISLTTSPRNGSTFRVELWADGAKRKPTELQTTPPSLKKPRPRSSLSTGAVQSITSNLLEEPAA